MNISRHDHYSYLYLRDSCTERHQYSYTLRDSSQRQSQIQHAYRLLDIRQYRPGSSTPKCDGTAKYAIRHETALRDTQLSTHISAAKVASSLHHHI